jgi:hypothetical protein
MTNLSKTSCFVSASRVTGIKRDFKATIMGKDDGSMVDVDGTNPNSS